MSLRFIKAEAAGNDLILVDLRNQSLQDAPKLAVQICNRHFGAGGDGLLTIETAKPESSHQYYSAKQRFAAKHKQSSRKPFVRMFNPDGTEDFCGGGLRCVAAYLQQSDTAVRSSASLRSTSNGGNNNVVMLTPYGSHEAAIERIKSRLFRVTVQLVTPEFNPARIPVRLPLQRILEYPLKIGERTWPISCVSIGTAHTLIFDDTEVQDEIFQETSPLIEHHPLFPEHTSVLWCQVAGRNRIRMRIWERGVGETFACGSGTCAAAVAGRALGRTDDQVEVITRGGTTSAEWDGKGPVRLTGEARIIYTGNW